MARARTATMVAATTSGGQAVTQHGERTAAVADPVLAGRIEFGGGQPGVGIEEQRVVSEPTLTAARPQDAAMPFALGDQRARVPWMAKEDQCAVEMRAAGRVRHRLKGSEQLVDVA